MLDVKKTVLSDSMTISGEYAYCHGKKGVIYCAPLNDLNDAKALYQLPLGCTDPMEDGYPHVDFIYGNNSAILPVIVLGFAVITPYLAAIYAVIMFAIYFLVKYLEKEKLDKLSEIEKMNIQDLE